jgi:hypothetical protein
MRKKSKGKDEQCRGLKMEGDLPGNSTHTLAAKGYVYSLFHNSNIIMYNYFIVSIIKLYKILS